MSELSKYEPEVYAALHRINHEHEPEWDRRFAEYVADQMRIGAAVVRRCSHEPGEGVHSSELTGTVPHPDEPRNNSEAEQAWAEKCRRHWDWAEHCVKLGLAKFDDAMGGGSEIVLTAEGRLALDKEPQPNERANEHRNTPPGRPGSDPKARRVPLRGYAAICQVLDLKDWKGKGKKDVRRANIKFNGPIKLGAKGEPPWVYKDELIAWWDNLEMAQVALSNAPSGEGLSTHNYARTGTVVPEIKGSVKERRRKQPS